MTWPNIRKGVWLVFVELPSLLLWMAFVLPVLAVFGPKKEDHLW